MTRRFLVALAFLFVLAAPLALEGKSTNRSGTHFDGRTVKADGEQRQSRPDDSLTVTLPLAGVEREITRAASADGRKDLRVAAEKRATLQPTPAEPPRISSPDIPSTESKIEVIPTGPGMMTPAVPPTKIVELLSLKTVMGSLLQEVVPYQVSPPGAVAKVDGDKVYVSIGASEGVFVADTLEIVEDAPGHKGAAGETASAPPVTGRLEVTSVQPHMAICKLSSGTAQQKDPSGRLNTVVLAGGSRIRVSAGAMNASEEEGISAAALKDAVVQALSSHPRLQYAERGETVYEIAADTASAEAGCALSLALMERASGRRIAHKETAFRNKVNLAELGFLGALSADLPSIPKFDAAVAALKQSGLQVQTAGPAAYIPLLGNGTSVWFFSSGRIVVAGKYELSAPKRVDDLVSAWRQVADCASGVTASIERDALGDPYRRTVEFYTRKAGVYQLLLAFPPASGEVRWILDWPSGRPLWAGLLAKGRNEFTGGYGSPRVRIGEIDARAKGYWAEDNLTTLLYGEHPLSAQGIEWLSVSAFFSDPADTIALRDAGSAPAAQRSVSSKALSSLYVPACDAYCTWLTAAPGPANLTAIRPAPTGAALPSTGVQQKTGAFGFVGEWSNEDFETGGISRINIRLDGSSILVHMWGKATPGEIDWGEATASVDGQNLSLTWNFGFAVETQELQLLADGRLQLTSHCHFTDKSGRQDYDKKDTYAKGIVHDWSDIKTGVDVFTGDWTNSDMATRGIAQMSIRRDVAGITVHMWGSGHPKLADLGDAKASAKGQTLSLTWNKGFAVETQELGLLADGRMQLTGHCHFTDKSGRQDYDSKELFTPGAACCPSRLKQIELALWMWQADHNGQSPQTLEDLVKDDYLRAGGDTSSLCCPITGQRYVYLGPVNLQAVAKPASTVLAYDAALCAGKIHVMWCDGHISAVSEDEFRRAPRAK